MRFRWTQLITAYVFVLFFAVGILVHGDYGVSADEPAVRKFGLDAFIYLFHGGPVPTELDWQFFNPVVPIFLHILERVFGLTDGRDIWFMRHFVTFLFFFGTIVAFYHIARLRFRDWKLPLLGCAMFILSPRLFAHGFYNPKDIPALFLFTMSAWTLLIFLERRHRWSLLIHIFFTALLISTRVFGLLMPVFSLLFLWSTRDRMTLKWSTTYIIGLLLILIAVWPLLWSNPLNIIGAFLNTTSRSGGGFYFGESFSTSGVPWHYLPVWIGITTPVVYSFFFLIGLVIALRYGRSLCTSQEMRPTGIVLLWFTLPVLALMIFPIGIFDEWRHMLFLYPAFLLIALEGIWWAMMIAKKYHPLLHIGIYGLIGLQMISTGFWMLKNHPFEYVYFSIPTQFIAGQFDLDYWGLSYRAGFEWIVENDAREHINVAVIGRVGKAAADTLPLADWERLYFVEAEDADYILDTFRDSNYRGVFSPEKEVHAIEVDGLKILAIAKK